MTAPTMKPPEHLSEPARKEWSRVIKELAEAGILAKLDRGTLAAYCQTYARWAEAEAKLAELGPVVKSPSGFPTANPYLTVCNTALRLMKTYAAELGLTPASRKRLGKAQGGKTGRSRSVPPQSTAGDPLTGLKIVRSGRTA